ncbi:16S rRNA (cytidine(1402)-2'-O)-methyltransferase [Jatrophihabitans telluris]|uniref:Ribosomal RNA small subunit methyltransferase I n=1 Tax=Jatrophihabitans telluris TaxID=2038343 RepID=A0ABY4R0M9_9ACTN|nr:16S rRNA (cytidine(1402)-2'-O)-methyltransferase [Jatrophihabitans telluris]UQX89330.1 16S rRNA (cytidine(1402)-2'-O)-methyltransferase [Jatrophihabitans telluris]
MAASVPAAERPGSGPAGRVILAGAPLGQPGDASARLVAALRDVSVIAAEDTRRLHRLASDLSVTITARVLSFFEGNEEGRVPQLLDVLRQGQDVLVITDGGMPSVSDPGYRLVAAALAEGLAVTVLPGPSAVTTAVAISGLPVDRFCFEGFLPRKPSARRARLAELAAERRTMVFFESPRRLESSLADLADAFGADRPAAVCRELTKTYEEVRRAGLADLARWAAGDVRGEITLVVGGALEPSASSHEPADLAALVAQREAAGQPRKEAIAEVAVQVGRPKREVFDAVVTHK